MTPELLSSIAAIVLSLVFSYFPKLNTWYAEKPEDFKKLTMLVMIAVVAGASFSLACAGIADDIFGLQLQCDQATALSLVQSFILAVAGNQTVFALTPKANSVKLVKALQSGEAELLLGRE